jgi:hypothetical protein
MQRDKRLKGAPEYMKFAFAVYGPLDNPKSEFREVIRSHCWADRELVEEVSDEDAQLGEGDYVFVVFNPDCVTKRTLTAIVLLDQGPRGGKVIPCTTVNFDAALRQKCMLASAVGKQSKSGECGPLKTSGAFLPGLGYVIAAQTNDRQSLQATFDFSSSKGLHIPDSKGMIASVEVTRKMSLVAELEADKGATSICTGYALKWKQ